MRATTSLSLSFSIICVLTLYAVVYRLYTGLYMLSKILLGIGVFSAFFAILIFSGKIPGIGNKEDAPKGEVVLWGTFPETQMNAVVQQFNPQAKTYRITYREVSEKDFSRALLEALANGTGPDLILAPYLINIKRVDLYNFL